MYGTRLFCSPSLFSACFFTYLLGFSCGVEDIMVEDISEKKLLILGERYDITFLYLFQVQCHGNWFL